MLKLVGHILGGTTRGAQDGKPLLVAWEAAVAHPYIGPQRGKIRGCGPSCVPHTCFAPIEMDACTCGQLMGSDVVYRADTVGHDHSIDVI